MRLIRYQTMGPRDGSPLGPRELDRCLTTNKRSYASEQDALDQAIIWAEQNRFDVNSISVYCCTDCGRWHHSKNRLHR